MLGESINYLTDQIITYIGNKRALLGEIELGVMEIQRELGRDKTVNLDLFSGSGVVARLLKGYSSLLVANDLERYSKVINRAYLINRSTVNWDMYGSYRNDIVGRISSGDLVRGVVSKLYTPLDDTDIKEGERCFYTNRNAGIIDTVRSIVEDFAEPYRGMFLAQLLYEASVKVNTGGVFKGFYKDKDTGIGKFGGSGENALSRILSEIEIGEIVLSNYECDVKVYMEDANRLVERLGGFDIVYIDPPYNQHPYGSNYFMLNVIVDNDVSGDISKVSGIPKNWNRSNYNVSSKAFGELEDLVSKVDTEYIIVSYSSDGFISYRDMVDMLSRYGKVREKEILYNTYRGCRNLSGRDKYVREYLFRLRKSN